MLPSAECDKRIATGDNFAAVLKSADPRLGRDLSIGEFLVAFGIYRDVICSVFPARRQELDAYLALIGDLNLKYGRNIFYQYHKALSSKSALYISQYNTAIDWSILDTELLVLLTGGQQALACNNCGDLGHSAPLCPRVPFQFPSQANTQATQPAVATAPSPNQSSAPRLDKMGRQVHMFNNKPVCNNFNYNVCAFPNCHFLHVCSSCGEAHPRFICPRMPSRPRPSRPPRKEK